MSKTYEVVAVSGGRGFEDYERLLLDLTVFKTHGLRLVVHGGHGTKRPRPWKVSADALAQRAAESLGLETKPFEVSDADWTRLGGGAGHARNAQMLEESRPSILLTYPTPKSRGTWHCAAHARKLGIPVLIWAPWIPEAEIDHVLRTNLGHYGLRTFRWNKNSARPGHIRLL